MILPYVEQYDKTYSKLEAFNKKFPEDMQKSILQYAIQGKLVEQKPEEETAEELYKQIQAEKERLIKEGKIKKEKPLSEITEDEIPFEIPESWKWVRLGAIINKLSDGTHSTPKYTSVKHISFAYDIAAVKANVLEKYKVKNIEINQYEDMKNIDTIIQAVSSQDQMIEMLMRARKSAGLCYYGIAHTPLIFRLGFKLGDQNNVMLLHKIRANNSLFDEWSKDTNGYSAIVPEESNKSVQSTELIVSISTSLKITKKDLESLKPENKHILNFESNVISFDSIMSYYQAESFRSAIMHGIRECVKKYNIKKIHMVISSSVAFTFLLGQALSAQHDPVTVVYHFEKNRYPWGICMNEEATNALVINDMAESIM